MIEDKRPVLSYKQAFEYLLSRLKSEDDEVTHREYMGLIRMLAEIYDIPPWQIIETVEDFLLK